MTSGPRSPSCLSDILNSCTLVPIKAGDGAGFATNPKIADMHHSFSILLSVFLFAVVPLSAQPLVIRNVNVVPMDEERVLPGQTVTIVSARIQEVTANEEAAPPADAEVIDGSGKFLLPGLAEMHAHVPGGSDEEQYRRDVSFLYLANGVTLIRGMQGAPVHLELREQLARGDIDGPRLYTAGPSFNGRSAPTPEAAVKFVQEQAEAGYDFIKVISGSPEAYEAMANEAKRRTMRFAGHVPAAVGVRGAIAAGQASIDHLDAYMPALVDSDKTAGIDGGFFGYRLAPFAEQERMREIARATRAAGVWVVPTESLMASVLTVDLKNVRETRPEFRYMPKRVVDGWLEAVNRRRADPSYDREAAVEFMRVRGQLILALRDEGAGLLLGSDAPQFLNVPGFSVHREMGYLLEAGLSPFEILQMGTVRPAQYFEEDDAGMVAAGMRADLILIDGNPLADLANAARIAGVIRGGKWYSRETIAERLEEIAARNAE